MQILLDLIVSVAAFFFGSVQRRLGFQAAINASLIALWVALAVAFTVAANTCMDAAGACGSAIASFTGLSEWLKFGFSLVPFEAIQIIGCLESLYLAGWAAVAIYNMTSARASGMAK